MPQIERRTNKNNLLPPELERFIPEMRSIQLLDIFFTRYRRIAYVCLYKQSVSRMTQEERGNLFRRELEQEVEIAHGLGGIGPEMFNRSLFDPEISSRDILNQEQVYSSLEETKKQATENASLLAYMDRLSSTCEAMVDMKSYRELKDFTNKYLGYIEQILDRPEYKAESERRAQELLDTWSAGAAHSQFSLFSRN